MGMSVRSSYFFIFFLICITFCQTPPPKSKKPPLLLRPLASFIEYHRKKGTHIDGPRCPMYPSCASYGQAAIRFYGVIGFWMLLDRLVYRETGELHKKYLPVSKKISKSLRYYDPLQDALPLFSPKAPSFLQENFSPVSPSEIERSNVLH